jgi:hypothetical protein
MEREYEGEKAVEIGCRGGQGSPRAVAPTGWQAGRHWPQCRVDPIGLHPPSIPITKINFINAN